MPKQALLAKRIIRLLPIYGNAEIANKLKCSYEYVRRIRQNPLIPDRCDNDSKDKAVLIAQKVRSGMSGREAAESLGISIKEVYFLVSRHFGGVRKIAKASGRPYRPISPLAQRIVELLPAKRDATIAKMVGCSRERVRQIRCKSGIPAPTDLVLQERIKRIRLLTKKGKTCREIADSLGVRFHLVYSIARKNSIKLNSCRKGNHIDSDRLFAFGELLKNDCDLTSTAELLEISYSAALRWKKRLGLKSVRKWL